MILVAFLVLFPASLAAGNTLVRVGLGAGPDYSRLSFTFKEPVESYLLRRADAGLVEVEFKAVGQEQGLRLPRGGLVDKLELGSAKNDLKASIQLTGARYEIRHFVSRDKLTVALDFRDNQLSGALEAGPLEVPALAQEAARLSMNLAPPSLGDGPEINLYRRVLGRLEIMDNRGALEDVEFFLEKFPGHILAADINYLLAELFFFEKAYNPAEEIWEKALGSWPDNSLAPRAQFMRAESARLDGRAADAAIKFKILAQGSLEDESLYKPLALLRAVDLHFSLGLWAEGLAMLEPVLKKDEAGRPRLEARARLGLAGFYQGFFSQANEIFLESLRLMPGLYLAYPEMLYAAGESYHYLNRPDISRGFLFRALNLMPGHPKASLIMTCLGDDYRREGRMGEALAVYRAVRQNYPNDDGGLISQLRLADMGALGSFFIPGQLFDVLEQGTRQATVAMYKKIEIPDSGSSWAELVQLQICAALLEAEENDEAIQCLKDIENNPRGSLLPEVSLLLSQALAAEAASLAEPDELELGCYDDSQASADVFTAYPDASDIPKLIYQRALNDWDKSRRDEAGAGWYKSSRLYPEKPLAEESLEQYRGLAAAGLADRASQATAEFHKLRPGAPGQAELMLEEAKDFLAAAKIPEAIEAWNRFRLAYPADPRNQELLLIQARQEMKSGRSQDALNHYQEILNRYPDNPRTPDVYLELAASEIRLGQRLRAWEHLNQFNLRFRDHPGRLKAVVEQAELSYQLGLADEAANLYRLFRQDYPGASRIPATYLAQAGLEIDLGRRQEAIGALEEGLAAFPALDNDKNARELLAELYLNEGQMEKWAALVEKTLEQAGETQASPAEKFFKYKQLAQVYQKLGRNEEAERNFDIAVASRPPDLAPESLYTIAKAYQSLNLAAKYANILALLASSPDALWQAVAAKELSELAKIPQ